LTRPDGELQLVGDQYLSLRASERQGEVVTNGENFHGQIRQPGQAAIRTARRASQPLKVGPVPVSDRIQ